MPLVHGGYLECGPVDGWPACRFEWTYEVPVKRKKGTVKPEPAPLLESEQIWQTVQDYFRDLGKPVPKEEEDWCMEAIRLEKEALEQPVDAGNFVPAPVVVKAERPEYGTPEFWKWCRETKKEREAAKAAKEAEKEAKAKAKAEAKAAKEAEKAAKAAAKKK